MVSSNVAKITCMILLWHSHASKLHMTKILRLTYLHFAPAFNLHCALQHLSARPAPTSHSSLFSTSELPQKLPDGTAHVKLQHLQNTQKMPLLVPGANHLISGSVLDEKMAALDVICQT